MTNTIANLEPETHYDRICQEHGYKNREDYISQLAGEYGADLDAVWVLANRLGPDEDFNGLEARVEDGDWQEYVDQDF